MPVLNNADAIYLGSLPVSAIYAGVDQVWPGDYWLDNALALNPVLLYDNNDLTTFLGARDSTPVAVNEAVGFQFDKASGMALGPEYQVAGYTGLNFDSYTQTATGFTGTKTTPGGNAIAYSSPTLPVNFGRWYRIEVDVAESTLSVYGINITSGTNSRGAQVLTSGAGTKVVYVLANVVQAPNNFSVTVVFSVLGTITVTGVRAREVAGVHRYEDLAAQRPFLRGTLPSDATPIFADDFSSGSTANFSAVNSTLSVVSGRLRVESLGGNGDARASITTVPGRTYRVRYSLQAGSSGTTTFGVGTTPDGGQLHSSGNYSGGNGDYREAYFTAVDAITYFRLRANGAAGSEAFVDGIDVYDVSADVVDKPYFLHYDGSNDRLITGPVNLTGTDEVTVGAGVNVLSLAGNNNFLELGTGGTNGSFRLYGTTGGLLAFLSRGTAQAIASSPGYVAPYKKVLVGAGKISSPLSYVRVDAAADATSTLSQGAGSYSQAVIYMGRRGVNTDPLNGYEYGFSLFPVAHSGANLAAIEAFHANRAGITI